MAFADHRLRQRLEQGMEIEPLAARHDKQLEVRRFRIVLATIEADVLPALPVHGRQTLKGRAEIRERAVDLPGRVSA